MKTKVKKRFLAESIVNIVCALALFIGIANLPIQYYSFLRTLTFIGCILILFHKKVALEWKLPFIPIAVLFNPIFPMYLYLKPYWIPMDIIAGILFLLISYYGYHGKQTKKKNEVKETHQKSKNRNMYNVKY